jgi:predicted SAM-dependent methyltransferase
MKLHLGCGLVLLPGWVNIDLEPGPGITVDDVRTLQTVQPEDADIIYAGHVLDHLGRNETDEVLKVWFSRLRPGGTLRLAVSSFEAAVDEYKAGRPLGELLGILVGGHKTLYDRHGTLFDRATLTAVLERAGFVDVREWDWRKVDHGSHDDFSQAYLPHMDKDAGRLMSLNLEATKPISSVSAVGQAFYRKEAERWGLDPRSSVPDLIIRNRELDAIVGALWDVSHDVDILEVGCGNGFLLQSLKDEGFQHVHGIEYLPEFVELAKSRNTGFRIDQGDVRNLPFADASYDVVICERVVINLDSEADQARSLAEMQRVLRPGGYLILLEAFVEPWERLNAARTEFSLPLLPRPQHNRWLRAVDFKLWTHGMEEVDHIEGQPVTPPNFLSSYFYVARVLHDVLLRATGTTDVQRAGPFVTFLSEALPPIGDYSIIQLRCLRKPKDGAK